jgi:hypothetical protein
MSKGRVHLIAGALVVLAALTLVGAHVAQASSSVFVDFTGYTPGQDPCSAAFGGPLSANSFEATVSDSSYAGGSSPECMMGLFTSDTLSVTPSPATPSLDIFVNSGNASSLSFKYALEGGEIAFYRNLSLIAGDPLSGSGTYSKSPAGGFDEVLILGFGYVDNLRFGFGGGGEAAAVAAFVPCPDNRINCHLYDDQIVLYHGAQSDSIDVFLVDGSSDGQFLFTINAADFGDYLNNPPAQNTLIDQVGDVSVYILTTGEVQVNYGPDANGKTYVIIMSGIGGGSPHGYTIP